MRYGNGREQMAAFYRQGLRTTMGSKSKAVMRVTLTHREL
jgi:hypothetical protein